VLTQLRLTLTDDGHTQTVAHLHSPLPKYQP